MYVHKMSLEVCPCHARLRVHFELFPLDIDWLGEAAASPSNCEEKPISYQNCDCVVK